MDHAVSGHGIHFFRVHRALSLEHFWTETGRAPAELKFLLDLGAVYLNSERLLGETNLNPNDVLRIHTEPKRYAMPTVDVDDLIEYESDNYLVLNKPAGIPVHPTLDNQLENCLSWLSRDCRHRFLVTNRIDVGTEGLIAFAKNERAQSIFMKQVQGGKIKKFYSAVCDGIVGIGKLEHWMMPSKYPPKVVTDVATSTWKQCLAHVREISPCGDFTECLLELKTGRTHQLRAQLSSSGAPILGDQMYGSKIKFARPQTWGLRSTVLGFRDESCQVHLELPRWQESEIRTRISAGTA